MMVWERSPSFSKLEYWEEVVLFNQIIHIFCVAARDCAHCTAFDGQYVTFGGVQYFSCGSREGNLFLQRLFESHLCQVSWQAKSLEKNLIPETPPAWE